jgi:hypothetical protein
MLFIAMLLGSMPKNTADAANWPKMRHSRQISRGVAVQVAFEAAHFETSFETRVESRRL